MHRVVHHLAYVRLGHEAVCERLEAGGAELLAEATDVAAALVAEMAPELTAMAEFFDADEPVTTTVGRLHRHRESASMDVVWGSDPAKRLLPSVDAMLEVNPIVLFGAAAMTELNLRGTYTPPAQVDAGPAGFFLQRRVVDAALFVFLRRLVDDLESAE